MAGPVSFDIFMLGLKDASPEGRDRWSLRLLADQVVLVEGIPPASRELIRRTLKKTRSSPGWCGDG